MGKQRRKEIHGGSGCPVQVRPNTDGQSLFVGYDHKNKTQHARFTINFDQFAVVTYMIVYLIA
jgi:hypothetical protein